jgi:hypothetical protein
MVGLYKGIIKIEDKTKLYKFYEFRNYVRDLEQTEGKGNSLWVECSMGQSGLEVRLNRVARRIR